RQHLRSRGARALVRDGDAGPPRALNPAQAATPEWIRGGWFIRVGLLHGRGQLCPGRLDCPARALQESNQPRARFPRQAATPSSRASRARTAGWLTGTSVITAAPAGGGTFA